MAILNELGVPCQTKCILLPSTKPTERTLFPPATGRLKEHIPLPSNGVLCPSIVMAAWALTLRCFIIADVISFRCCPPATSTCVARVDLDEPVATFVRRFAAHGEATSTSIMTEVPVGPFVSFVPDQASASHQCNTAVRVSDCEHELTSAKHIGAYADMTVTAVPNSASASNCAAAFLDYDRSHTTDIMASNVMRTFTHIFRQLLDAPDSFVLQDIDMCPAWDRALIQQNTSAPWNAMSSSTLHDLIVKQCRMRPDKLAVCSYDGDLTYGQLDDLTARLAHYLVKLGVGPGTFTLSCFVKSTWAIVARLAILRAGGAYISVHAQNPPIYLESVIRRTKAQVLLTDSRSSDRFRGVVPTVVELDTALLRSKALPPDDKWFPKVQAHDACLVLFTSGSTGTPKGIVQTHQAYVAAIENYARDLNLGPHTRYLQYDDYAFDISNLEFLVPLILGGCCCVPAPIVTVDDLTQEIRTLKANIAFITPTVAIRIEPDKVPSLEILCIGGEPLPMDMVRKWKGSATQLVNQYGMGEVAVCCALNLNPQPDHGTVVGHPSTGSLWIVDPSTPDKLMPVGGIGEILIEGPHLARGYLDQVAAAQSEAKFLPLAPQWMAAFHPQRRMGRMYRSGDLGRMRNDGSIEYLGRKDMILKLDGNRIDALEVEYQARKCLSSSDTVIVDLLGVIDGGEDPRLTALLFLEDHPMSRTPASPRAVPTLADAVQDVRAAPLVTKIRAQVAQSLPPNMIPTQFLLVSWIPRTASRKVDRKMLHALGQQFCRANQSLKVYVPYNF